jgi:hypothetical protein
VPLALSGHIADFLAYHGQRGLHVESTLGALYGIACALGGRPAAAVLDFGSFNFHGAVPDALAAATPWATLASIGVVAVCVARAAPADRSGDLVGRITCAVLAAMTALWLAGKVLSPQYLTWAIPLVLAVPSDRPFRARIVAAFLAALLLGQLYWRGYYDLVYEQRAVGLLTLGLRQAALVACFAWALRASVSASATSAAPQTR